MKYSILILLFSTKLCVSQNVKNNVVSTETNKNIVIEYLEPIDNFNVKINWNIIDSIPDTSIIIGPATIEIQRISDNKKFDVNYENFTLKDSTYSEKIYKKYAINKLPNILQLSYNKEESSFFFQDINFDNNLELIIIETLYEDEMKLENFRIFEFGNDKLNEIEYFPTDALNWSGEIDYIKKEVIVREYLNCCDYYAEYYKFDSNHPDKFISYKSEEHLVDAATGNEEITIKEKGKKDVIIFKKKQ